MLAAGALAFQAQTGGAGLTTPFGVAFAQDEGGAIP